MAKSRPESKTLAHILSPPDLGSPASPASKDWVKELSRPGRLTALEKGILSTNLLLGCTNHVCPEDMGSSYLDWADSVAQWGWLVQQAIQGKVILTMDAEGTIISRPSTVEEQKELRRRTLETWGTQEDCLHHS